ncbi:hypothetical protein BC938DRAFT_482257 [Jimgerdemannia flammicorona]|uniref:Uncharacterized protein n=1 Tax=Jimgerdemannia flammicorona TaxID=994334 RepID=A0A433R0D8_9FUNG|nr:hypothetical protein BC938DRAFT_482257 [Jimgerdemannia flammicorona]
MNGNVVVTGTSYDQFGRNMNGRKIFVGPLSQVVFDKLLQLHPYLGIVEFSGYVKGFATSCRANSYLSTNICATQTRIPSTFTEDDNFYRQQSIITIRSSTIPKFAIVKTLPSCSEGGRSPLRQETSKLTTNHATSVVLLVVCVRPGEFRIYRQKKSIDKRQGPSPKAEG